ncbi:MAG: class I SAM-dependent methyltransferase [Chloroflexi bacterium]|nr:class I SAM-dependent methyltransferase [Chloroflexota bacterium]
MQAGQSPALKLSGDYRPMDLIEKATIIHYHRNRIDTFADGSVEALGWRGPASQTTRFEVLAQVGDLSGRSVLDVGCGYGDLKGFLDQRFSGITYIGIDQMPEFIAEAKERYKDCADTHFYQTDFTTLEFPSVDYVLASGALGYRCEDPGFYSGMVRKMYDAAKRALAFNMLDADRFPDHPLLIGHNLDEVVQQCQDLCPNVQVIQGYLDDDFTVFLRRD